MADMVVLRKTKHYKEHRETNIGDYKTLYRFSAENVTWLADYFLNDCTETRGGALSPKMKMKIFLRCLANPGFQSGIAEELGVHQSTVSKALEDWQNVNHFPGVIGVIDCTHIRIEKPGRHGDEYINRKGWPSINVQATCNAQEMFTSVDASWPGSVHDTRVWKNSTIREVVQKFPNASLLGDQGYGLELSLLTPYRNTDTEAKLHYNRLLKRERCIIERCFGQVKRRFPILKYICRLKLRRISRIIICCFIMHNIAKHLKDEEFPEEEDEDDTDENDEDDNQNQHIPDNEMLQRARVKRDEIADIIVRRHLY
ncbi:putative nuclease HARBI1 [Zophobas morio]|uniref:putative nuclease HARBI1 n=1 Tax=Zophobas morio TaxID=2755281 RepID=UPI003083EA51